MSAVTALECPLNPTYIVCAKIEAYTTDISYKIHKFCFFFERMLHRVVPENPLHVWIYSTTQPIIHAKQFLIKS